MSKILFVSPHPDDETLDAVEQLYEVKLMVMNYFGPS